MRRIIVLVFLFASLSASAQRGLPDPFTTTCNPQHPAYAECERQRQEAMHSIIQQQEAAQLRNAPRYRDTINEPRRDGSVFRQPGMPEPRQGESVFEYQQRTQPGRQ